MSDCPFKPSCNEDCTACTDADKADKIDRVVEALQPIVANIVEVLTPAHTRSCDSNQQDVACCD